ncbi:MAG: 6-bladed beta-propeller [Bacteroidales bacterium]|nr:6-bladed beta-propeller [Bacteroidales bacterium]
MKNKPLIEIALLLLTCMTLSCTQTSEKAETQAGVPLKIYSDSLTEGDLLANMQCRFVKLETTPECYISKIEKVIYADSLFFVLDWENKLYEFDHDGHFLHTISCRGNAKNEYNRIGGIFVNSEKRYVGIFDNFKKTILKYDYNGHFLEAQSNLRYIGEYSYAYIDHCFVYNQLSSSQVPYSFAVYNLQSGEVSYHVPHLETAPKGGLTGSCCICSVGNKAYAIATYNDTVFQVTQEGVVPLFEYIGPVKHATAKYFRDHPMVIDDNGPMHNPVEKYRIIENDGYSAGLNWVVATDSILLFSSTGYQHRELIWYDFNKGKAYKYSPQFHEDYYFFSGKDYLISVIPMNENIDPSPKLKELRDASDEGDNPILKVVTHRH